MAMFRKKCTGNINDVWNHKNPLPDYTPDSCQSNFRPPFDMQIFPDHGPCPIADKPVDSQDPPTIISSDEEEDFSTWKARTQVLDNEVPTTSSPVPPATGVKKKTKRKRTKSKRDNRRYLLVRKDISRRSLRIGDSLVSWVLI